MFSPLLEMLCILACLLALGGFLGFLIGKRITGRLGGFCALEALRASEEKHRLLIERSHSIIFTLSTEGIFNYVSPAWAALLGHPADQVVGQPFQRFVHPDFHGRSGAFLQKVLETGLPQEGAEYQIHHIDGSWRWHTTNAVAIIGADGKPVGIEGSASDITERKHDREVRRMFNPPTIAETQPCFQIFRDSPTALQGWWAGF